MAASDLDEQTIRSKPSLVTTSVQKRELWLAIFALTALYILAVAIGNRRYVWFDELFTFDIGRSASLQQLWYRVRRFDCNPPTVYLLSGLSMSLFGQSAFGLRFPSMLEFYAGSIAILLYVRRKVGTAFATVAVLMVWAAGPTLYYAVEARPYALLFGSFACLLLSWDIAIRAQRRRLALLGISLSCLALTVTHVFAPFTLFAFIAAEIIRFLRTRKKDLPLWIALLLPLSAGLLYIPLVRLYSGLVFSNLTRASYGRIFEFFENTLSAPILFLALVAAFAMPLPKRDKRVAAGPLPEEVGLFTCMLLSPVVLNLVLMRRQGLFYDRYAITTQAAIFAALAILFAVRLRLSRPAAYAASATLAIFILKTQIFHVIRHPEPKNATFLTSIEPDLPIVIGSGTTFMEMNQHETAGLLSRLYFLKDPQASMRYAHTNYFQDFEAPDEMRNAGFPFTANVATYADFVAHNKQFLLLGDTNNPSEWVFPKLRPTGAFISVIGDYGAATPYTDHTLYLVTMPGRPPQP